MRGRLSFIASFGPTSTASSGYNIAGPEVLCRIPPSPNAAWSARPTRRADAKAYVVLSGGCHVLTQALQDHVKQTIAPYKYRARIEYVAQLPKTEAEAEALCAPADGRGRPGNRVAAE